MVVRGIHQIARTKTKTAHHLWIWTRLAIWEYFLLEEEFILSLCLNSKRFAFTSQNIEDDFYVAGQEFFYVELILTDLVCLHI